jgi:hypothetical protein
MGQCCGKGKMYIAWILNNLNNSKIFKTNCNIINLGSSSITEYEGAHNNNEGKSV